MRRGDGRLWSMGSIASYFLPSHYLHHSQQEAQVSQTKGKGISKYPHRCTLPGSEPTYQSSCIENKLQQAEWNPLPTYAQCSIGNKHNSEKKWRQPSQELVRNQRPRS